MSHTTSGEPKQQQNQQRHGHPNRMLQSVLNTNDGTLTVVVPRHVKDETVKNYFDSVVTHMVPHAKRVVVIDSERALITSSQEPTASEAKNPSARLIDGWMKKLVEKVGTYKPAKRLEETALPQGLSLSEMFPVRPG